MSINLASKYESQILNAWIHSSYIAGKLSNKYNFAGVRSITIYSPLTVPLQDYDKTADVGSRFGSTTEMQDEIQELSMGQDKAFSISIDKGYNTDQLNIKGAGEMLKLQIDEQLTPFTDKYTIAKIAREGGKSVVAGATVTKDTIVALVADAETWFENQAVPMEGRHLFMGASYFNKVRLSDEFLNVDPLAVPALGRGVVGQLFGFTVTRVPDAYMPTDVVFLAFHRDSGLNPFKLKTMRILNDVPGLDGSLLEGRQYFDAFVLGRKAVGIYSCLEHGTAQKVALPAIAWDAYEATVTCATSGSTIKYTVDGSDPRYSKSAEVYSAPVQLADGDHINVVAFKSGLFFSELVSEDAEA